MSKTPKNSTPLKRLELEPWNFRYMILVEMTNGIDERLNRLIKVAASGKNSIIVNVILHYDVTMTLNSTKICLLAMADLLDLQDITSDYVIEMLSKT